MDTSEKIFENYIFGFTPKGGKYDELIQELLDLAKQRHQNRKFSSYVLDSGGGCIYLRAARAIENSQKTLDK
jgi:hypothetical protein